jgi:hypothetical protein
VGGLREARRLRRYEKKKKRKTPSAPSLGRLVVAKQMNRGRVALLILPSPTLPAFSRMAKAWVEMSNREISSGHLQVEQNRMTRE